MLIVIVTVSVAAVVSLQYPFLTTAPVESRRPESCDNLLRSVTYGHL